MNDTKCTILCGEILEDSTSLNEADKPDQQKLTKQNSCLKTSRRKQGRQGVQRGDAAEHWQRVTSTQHAGASRPDCSRLSSRTVAPPARHCRATRPAARRATRTPFGHVPPNYLLTHRLTNCPSGDTILRVKLIFAGYP